MFNYLALNLAISGAAPIDEPRLLDIFWSACAEGSVKFRDGEAHKREFGDLPFWVRQYYRGVKKLVSVYQLGEQETAYLIFFDNTEAWGHEYTSGCAVAAQQMSLDEANKFVTMKYAGEVVPLKKCRQNVRWECSKNSLYFEFFPEDISFQIRGVELSTDFNVIQLSKLKKPTQQYLERHRSLRDGDR